jgi:P pilus assembly chaperone PapD
MHLKSILQGCALLLLFLITTPSAWADLSIFPTRIVLEKNQRSAQVELMNNGTEPLTYRINLVNRRMGENGELIEIDQTIEGELFADPLLRFSPRQVQIQPGSSQIVRILVRKPAELLVGEYRSHLQFDRLPQAGGATSIENSQKSDNQEIGVVITALVGASIPVILRHGDTQASVSLSKLKLEWSGNSAATSAAPELMFTMNRSGTRSVFGDLMATFTARNGATVELAKMGGVAVYVPNALRRVRMPLTLPKGVDTSGGTLKLVYRERADAGLRVLAEAVLAFP